MPFRPIRNVYSNAKRTLPYYPTKIRKIFETAKHLRPKQPCFRLFSGGILSVAVARENQRAETRLVDEDRLTFVVRTSVANCDVGFVFFIYMPSQSRPSANGPSRFLHFLGAFHRSLIRENQSCYEDLTNS